MTVPLESFPRFEAADALAIARREYALDGAVAGLPSERDQNFLITAPDGRRLVLKIANARDTPELLDFQNQAMNRVAAADAQCRVQAVLRSRQGREIEQARSASGAAHCVRVMTWLEGRMLSEASPPREPDLLASIGDCMARVGLALENLTHPAMHRELQWDIRHASMAREHVHLLPPARRPLVERLLHEWRDIDWQPLRQGVIHGDANDNNVLVTDGRMSGLLDFGDMTSSATVCDLAIALAYTLIGESDPLGAAAPLVDAYHRARPLLDAERSALPILLRARLAMSVCYSAHNRLRHPDDPYQVVSEAGAWGLLDRLEARSTRGELKF